jgi:hypothetical protein
MALRQVFHWAEQLLKMDLDEGIDLVLRSLGETYKVDRAWVIRYNHEITHFWNSHEWTGKGVTSFANDLQMMPVTFGAWIHEQMLRDMPVGLSNVEDLPAEADDLKREFRVQCIRSILCVPVHLDGRLTLQVGFDAVKRRRKWDKAETAVLRGVGMLMARRFLWENPPKPRLPEYGHAVLTPRVSLHDSYETVIVPEIDIRWIEAVGDYTRIHLRGGRTIMQRQTLKNWQNQLTAGVFLRVHRRAIVNCVEIKGIVRKGNGWLLTLQGESAPISVGRAYRHELRRHRIISNETCQGKRGTLSLQTQVRIA